MLLLTEIRYYSVLYIVLLSVLFKVGKYKLTLCLPAKAAHSPAMSVSPNQH